MGTERWGHCQCSVALTISYVTTERISGQLVSQIIRNNGSVRIFEVLGRKRAREAGRVGDQTFRLKERLMSDYARPGPIPPGTTVTWWW